ncbi:MAG: sulfite exporter TauE/SafE family protein [Pseudomonadota bacterium]
MPQPYRPDAPGANPVGRFAQGLVGSAMDLGILTQIAPTLLIASFAVAILSGVIKGAIGFGMPLVILSGLSTFLDPKLALIGMIAPIVVSNALQALRTGVGPAIEATRSAWRYMLIVCIMIFAAAQLVPVIPSEAFYFVLGIPVLILALIQLMGLRLIIPLRHRGWAEWAVGLISGVLGGLAGTWGPTTVLYLLAIDMPKARQVIVQGMIYGTGSVTLLFAHLRSGLLNAETIPFTLALLPTALVGMWIGFQIQDKLDQEKFRKLTLIVLVIAALNLLRKGLLS